MEYLGKTYNFQKDWENPLCDMMSPDRDGSYVGSKWTADDMRSEGVEAEDEADLSASHVQQSQAVPTVAADPELDSLELEEEVLDADDQEVIGNSDANISSTQFNIICWCY